MADRLREAESAWWPEATDDEEAAGEMAETVTLATPDHDRVGRLIEALSDDEPETLDGGLLTELRELANDVEANEDDLANALRQLADHEGASDPSTQARDVLRQRVPLFVRFDDEARLLRSEYDLNVAVADPGAALRNLAALADLDLGELQSAIARGETGTVRDLRESANRVLAARFSSWQQHPPVTVVLENEGTILRIHVQSGTGPTMQFHERSDGLRQFVALVALTAQGRGGIPPILLIDEIETHLHYDAQADLLEVLAEQNAVPQIIYTTHSAACLPEDLGLGVRVVHGIEDRTASTVRQNFWRDEHPGIGALLMAMGAASLAFVPLRPAVIAEGGTELVLLPSLLREANDRDHLSFAVVPGSSSTPPDRIAGLDLHGVRTVWVLDADDGGRTRRDQLIDVGIPADRVLMLSDDSDLEIEDVVAPACYCEAVRRYVADVGGTTETFTPDDLPAEPCQRHDAVLAWCHAHDVRPPGKIAVANKIIELVGELQLVDQAQTQRLQDLYARLVGLLSRTPVGGT
jgi:hypothetical protein